MRRCTTLCSQSSTPDSGTCSPVGSHCILFTLSKMASLGLDNVAWRAEYNPSREHLLLVHALAFEAQCILSHISGIISEQDGYVKSPQARMNSFRGG